MIQFNLLPDVKIEYLKARRTKRFVMLASAIITSIGLTVLVVLFVGVNVVQKNHLNNLKTDIEAASKQLREEPDLSKILTVQQQLTSLDGLHQDKPAAERLGTYLSQITPSDVTISNFEVDFDANSMTFDGSAPSLKAVNQFVDTLKFTTYETVEGSGKAFTSVVLSSFSRSEQSQDENPATYQITLSYDPIIMDGTQAVTLKVPRTTTTRSATERPSGLFQQTGGQ
jgi:hypothetical protein